MVKSRAYTLEAQSAEYLFYVRFWPHSISRKKKKSQHTAASAAEFNAPNEKKETKLALNSLSTKQHAECVFANYKNAPRSPRQNKLCKIQTRTRLLRLFFLIKTKNEICEKSVNECSRMLVGILVAERTNTRSAHINILYPEHILMFMYSHSICV